MNQSSNKAVKKVGNAVDFVDKVKDAGEMIIEYKRLILAIQDRRQTLSKKSVQKTIEQVPVVGDAAEVIMNDSKQDDGLTNLKIKGCQIASKVHTIIGMSGCSNMEHRTSKSNKHG